MHAFSPDHIPVKDFDPETGSGYILILYQVLMFTDRLEHTLISPNQVRTHGHSLCNDRWDKNRPLVIKPLKRNVAIPFLTKGIIIGFDYVTQSSEDLSAYPRIELTADVTWNLSNVKIAVLLHERLYNIASYGVTSKRDSSTTPQDPRLHYNEYEMDIIYQVFLFYTPK